MQTISFDVGIRNLAYCILDVNKQIITWKKEDLGCKKHDAQGLADAVTQLLYYITTTELDTSQPITVLIEVQMQAVMKCIQTAINVFFKTAKLTGLITGDLRTAYVSPKLKLKFIAAHPEFEQTQAASTKYQQNKVDAVAFTRWYLTVKNPDTTALEVLNANKKADDIADCALQAFSWMAYSK
ncbi:hypothetical protein EBT25_15270 [bacterium]|nr:hypothetical protein [bacterium]